MDAIPLCMYGEHCDVTDCAHAHPDNWIRRKSCRYGLQCRDLNNVDHTKMFTHEKQMCKFGMRCRKLDDFNHVMNYNHMSCNSEPAQRICHYGSLCTNRSNEHVQNFYHPDGQAPKPLCKFANTCRKKNDKKHLESYAH
jgi:hypothetical protein